MFFNDEFNGVNFAKKSLVHTIYCLHLLLELPMTEIFIRNNKVTKVEKLYGNNNLHKFLLIQFTKNCNLNF